MLHLQVLWFVTYGPRALERDGGAPAASAHGEQVASAGPARLGPRDSNPPAIA